MKKFGIFFSILLTVAMAATAFAGTRLFRDSSKAQNPIQNVTGPSAVPAAGRCDTVGSGSAVFKQYTASGYLGIKATAANHNTGAPLVVKWLENGKQVWVGSSYEGVNEAGTAISNIKAQAFDNHSGLFCVRRH